MDLRDIELDPPKRLAHLPLIMGILRRMRIVELIDQACGVDRRMKASHGEALAVILLGIFAGEHGLWRLQDRLDVYDLATIMQDPGFDLRDFHDVRFGRMLDALYRAGPDKIQSELAIRTIEAYSLKTDFLSFDATTLTFYGAYEHQIDPGWEPEVGDADAACDPPPVNIRHCSRINGDGREAPRVVHGYAKNRRHDLKQILYGSVVTRDGGVPLYGRAMDGNTSDITAASVFLEHLRSTMPDVGQQCLVADCKGWAPRVLDQVRGHRLRLLSRLPRTTTLSHHCLDAFDRDAASCLLRKYSERRKRWSFVAYQGADAEYAYTHTITVRDAKGKDRLVKETAVLPVRTVTCFSSALYRQKRRTLAKIRERERRDHGKAVRAHAKRRFRCAADAQTAADEWIARQPWITLTPTVTVVEEVSVAKRSRRGRPRKDEPPPQQTIAYRLEVTVQAADERTIDQRLRRSATYVLIRNRIDGWDVSDEEMVAAYTDQWRVEHGFAWLKSQAAINPMFLETDRRIEALCLIYHIALMVQTLVQRTVRSGLRQREWMLPYHRNKPSDKITARFTYELFRNVTTMTIRAGDESEKRLFGFDEHTRKAVVALGLPASTYDPIPSDAKIVLE